MPINAVQRLHYEAMVLDIANKILITGKQGILWTVEALEYIVMRNKRVPKGDHIPNAIYRRAKELRELIKDKDLYAAPEDFPEYVSIVKETVGSKIKSLLWLSDAERQALIRADRQRMAAAKRRKPPVQHRHPPHSSILSEEEVNLREQWRLNLMSPYSDEPGLNSDEMGSLGHIIDNDRYPWAYAMLLTANLPLAHWLATPDISLLIYNGRLNIHCEEHHIILTEPTAAQMRAISLLSPLLNLSLMTVSDIADLTLSEEDEQTLSDPAFRQRLQTLPLQQEDYRLLTEMGILEESYEVDSDEAVGSDNDTWDEDMTWARRFSPR